MSAPSRNLAITDAALTNRRSTPNLLLHKRSEAVKSGTAFRARARAGCYAPAAPITASRRGPVGCCADRITRSSGEIVELHPLRTQDMTPSDEALWDEWRRPTLNARVFGELVALGTQRYQDARRLSTGFIRELAGSPSPAAHRPISKRRWTIASAPRHCS